MLLKYLFNFQLNYLCSVLPSFVILPSMFSFFLYFTGVGSCSLPLLSAQMFALTKKICWCHLKVLTGVLKSSGGYSDQSVNFIATLNNTDICIVIECIISFSFLILKMQGTDAVMTIFVSHFHDLNLFSLLNLETNAFEVCLTMLSILMFKN